MNISTILEAVQPLADSSYEVIETTQKLRRSVEYPLAFDFKDPLYNYTKALENLSSKASAFPESSIPSIFSETIQNLRLETDERLDSIPMLTTRLEAFFSDRARLTKIIHNPDADKLLIHCPIPTIDIFYQLSKSATGLHYGHQFRVDPYPKTLKEVEGTPAEKWTWNFKSQEPLLFCVSLKEGIEKKDFRRIVKTFPKGGVAEKAKRVWPCMHDVSWIVGLTCDEREVLLLQPLVKDVRPYRPYFHMSMAFD
ncbi:hypothetical protein N431DRAFT_462362 [Stipitochalara longipes BDJ]|nr:hypothetical protein N431DRAFT_462362 [Stipitochalara longipes BDJ]